MKQISSYLLMTISVLGYAQNRNSIRLGMTAGADYSDVNNAHRPSGPKFSFQGGALALIPIGSSNQYFIQPEVVYYDAGETRKDSSFKTGNRNAKGYNAVYANNYLSVPLYFKMYAFKSNSSFFAIADPRFNFFLNQKTTNSPIDRPYYDLNYTGTTPLVEEPTNLILTSLLG